MVDPVYSWPGYPTGSEDHLKALGVISLNFNLYEFSLLIFLERHLNKEVANLLFGKLNNAERSAVIRALFKSDPEREVQDEVAYSLRHFATCAENRNILMHSQLIMPDTDMLALEKFARGNADKIHEFLLDVGDLRNIADEMNAGFEFVLSLWHYFEDRDRYHQKIDLAENGIVVLTQVPPEHPTLPKRPPEPRHIKPNRSG